MKRHGVRSLALTLALGLSIITATEAQAQHFDMGGFAGGMIGGVIAGAMMSNAQPQGAVVLRSRPRYRHVASRHYAKASHPAPTSAAVVDTNADPFAAKASASALPISAKP